MFGKVDFRLFLLLVCFGAVVGIGIIGCGGDEDDDGVNGAANGDNEWIERGYNSTQWIMYIFEGENRYNGSTYGNPDVNDILVDREDVAPLISEPPSYVRTSFFTFHSDGTMEAIIDLHYHLNRQPESYYDFEGSTYSLSGTRFTINLTLGDDVEQTITGTWSNDDVDGGGNTLLALTRDDGRTATYRISNFGVSQKAGPGLDDTLWKLRNINVADSWDYYGSNNGEDRYGNNLVLSDAEVEDILVDDESVAALNNTVGTPKGLRNPTHFARADTVRFNSDGTMEARIYLWGHERDNLNRPILNVALPARGTYSLSGTGFTIKLDLGHGIEQTITGKWYRAGFNGKLLKLKRDDGRTAMFSYHTL